MARLPLLALAALLASGCGSNSTEGPGSLAPSETSSGTTGVFFGNGSTTSTGGEGENSLDGTWAFDASSASATAEAGGTGSPGETVVNLADANDLCLGGLSDAANALTLTFALDGGGAPTFGTYSLDEGISVVRVANDSSANPSTLATAISGQVTLNQVTTSDLGGNFTVTMQDVDGGTSQLTGIFDAAVCD